MKKIGIITVSRTNNFGAELQAYALQKKLQLLGYNAEIIDYLYFKHKNYKSTSGSEPIHAFSLKEKMKQFALYRIVTPIIESVGAVFSKSIANRIKNFERFHRDHVRFSPQYRSLKELESAKHDYDIFMVGSDQVWNPGTATSLAPYFLMFAPNDKRKISYASSFGVSRIDQQHYSQYKAWLSNLDKIAVRENDGVRLIADIAGKEATRVLDPTLLLNKSDWIKVISKPQSLPDRFLLIYQLHESESIQKWVTFIKDKFGLDVVNICKRAFLNKEIDGVRNIGDAGPAEFIELFSRASFVITNSFHGTAFSVNFNVPFFTVLKKGKSNNSRMLDFLKINGLDSRIVYEGQSPSNFPESDLLCDFSIAKLQLEQERKASVDYLTNSLLS